MGKEAGKEGKVIGMGETPIKAPPIYKKPTLVKRLRAKVAVILVNLAYKVSWDGYLDAVCDGDFGYCPDCEQCGNPEWRCR